MNTLRKLGLKNPATVEELLKLLKHNGKFIFDKRDLKQLKEKLNSLEDHKDRENASPPKKEVETFMWRNLLGKEKKITVRRIGPSIPKNNENATGTTPEKNPQYRARCKPIPQIIKDTDEVFFPYRIETRLIGNYESCTVTNNYDETSYRERWKRSLFSDYLQSHFKNSPDIFRNIDTIYCFGRGFRCFDKKKEEGRWCPRGATFYLEVLVRSFCLWNLDVQKAHFYGP